MESLKLSWFYFLSFFGWKKKLNHKEADMKIEIYKDKKKEWRARFKSKNGRILVVSSEGYKRKRNLMRALGTVVNQAGNAKVVEV